MIKLGSLFLIASVLFAQAPTPRVILISVDGLMARTVRNAEKLGVKLPNLTEFRDRGAMAEGLRGVFPTVTYPNHTTMVTGRTPAEHGIVSNTLFDPERNLNGAWYWYAELIKAPTLWDAAHQAGLTTAAVGWPVTAGAKIDHNYPEYRPSQTLDGILLSRSLATPGLLAEFEKSHGPLKFADEHFDDGLSDIAAFLIESRKPNFLLVHLVDLDHDQHGNGPESPVALRTLENIDRAIGKLRKAADKAGVGGQTRWIIISDHGFWKVEHAFHPEAFLSSLGLSGDAKTWKVATQPAGGSSAFISNDPADTESQALVSQQLKRLKEDGGYGIDRVIERAELKTMGASPSAFLAITMKEGWVTGSARTGAWVTSSGKTKGTHGYAPGPETLDSTFIAFGPGIRHQTLPRSELTNVAPTVARLLGIPFPSAHGRDLLAAEQPSSR